MFRYCVYRSGQLQPVTSCEKLLFHWLFKLERWRGGGFHLHSILISVWGSTSPLTRDWTTLKEIYYAVSNKISGYSRSVYLPGSRLGHLNFQWSGYFDPENVITKSIRRFIFEKAGWPWTRSEGILCRSSFGGLTYVKTWIGSPEPFSSPEKLWGVFHIDRIPQKMAGKKLYAKSSGR